MRRVIRSAAAGALAMAAVACGGSATPSATTAPTTSPGSAAATRPASQPSSGRSRDWPTYHADGGRSGAVAAGPALGRVRRLWSTPVAGAVYAEPLFVGGRVIVATEDDNVYSLDAGDGRVVWEARLGTPVAGGSLPCGNLDPSGITGTPVADPRSGRLFAVVYRAGFRHDLVALDAHTGRTLWRRPIDPPGGDYTTEQQRPALALSRGRVYISYGGLYGDCGRYHGWVLGAPAANPSGALVTYQVPSANEGAIWAPSGPAVDRAGNLYVATGNGSSSSFDFGNAVIRLSPDLKATSFFAPPDAGALNTSDTDLGSTGPVLLPNARAFIVGKSGIGYLVNTDDLGGIGHSVASIGLNPTFGSVAYADETLYVPAAGGLTAVRVSGDRLSRSWSQSAATLPPIVAGSAVWALGDGTLYQLDPRDGSIRFKAEVGEAAHFATPTAGAGRVYVAAGGRVQAFG